MKTLIIYLIFFSATISNEVNSLFSQVDSTFRYKQEAFFGFNYDVKYDSTFFGINLGYSRFIQDSKRIFYRIDVQNHKQYFSSTFGNNNGKNAEDYYKDLTVNRITLNNMFSLRFFQKHKDRFYFELGFLIGIDLWQQKKGKYFKHTGFYEYAESEDIVKKGFLVPKNAALHIGCGIRVSKKILLKPELRLSVLTFDRVYEGQENRNLGTVLLAHFNLSYLF